MIPPSYYKMANRNRATYSEMKQVYGYVYIHIYV